MTQVEDGRKDGKQIEYYENGQIKSQQKYIYGKSEMETIRWKSDGTILY